MNNNHLTIIKKKKKKASGFILLVLFSFSVFSCKSNKSLTVYPFTIMEEPVVRVHPPCETTTEIKLPERSDYPQDVVISRIVEELPLFDGKDVEIGFREYVDNNINYPAEAVSREITGCVVVEFIIEKDGSISNAKVISGVDPLLEAEALRVINNSPAIWTPAEMRGKAIRLLYRFPVIFELTTE